MTGNIPQPMFQQMASSVRKTANVCSGQLPLDSPEQVYAERNMIMMLAYCTQRFAGRSAYDIPGVEAARICGK